MDTNRRIIITLKEPIANSLHPDDIKYIFCDEAFVDMLTKGMVGYKIDGITMFLPQHNVLGMALNEDYNAKEIETAIGRIRV